MIRKIEVERFSLTTSKPFDEVVAYRPEDQHWEVIATACNIGIVWPCASTSRWFEKPSSRENSAVTASGSRHSQRCGRARTALRVIGNRSQTTSWCIAIHIALKSSPSASRQLTCQDPPARGLSIWMESSTRFGLFIERLSY
jgi:hypothetical protein